MNSLTRYHFTEKEDVELLNKLIQEENEFVLSCFDVFDSDKDHENLIDSLQRILDKSKSMGLQYQRITPSAFYQNYSTWEYGLEKNNSIQFEKIDAQNRFRTSKKLAKQGRMHLGSGSPKSAERPPAPHRQCGANGAPARET